MIIHDTTTIPVAVHGIPVWSPFQRPVSTKTWYGVAGALTLIGANTVRECVVEATMTNYPTLVNFENAVTVMVNAMDNALRGTLYIDGIPYPRCVFFGWEPAAPPFYDGSGQHGWTQFGRLRWVQTR